MAVLAVLLAGCRSGWRSSSTAPVPAKPPQETARLTSAEVERRADAHAYFATGLIHDLREEPEAAEAAFAHALEKDPTNEPLLIELSQRLLQRRQTDRALDLLEPATSRAGASPQVWMWYGTALAQAGRANEAVNAQETALKGDPKLLFSYYALVYLALERKDVPGALAVIDRAIARDDWDASQLIGMAEMLSGNARSRALPAADTKPRVLRLLERAARLAPTEPSLLHGMADLYRRNGELDRATQLYEELLEKAGANPGATAILREQLIQLYYLAGRRADASRLLRDVMRENPNNPRVHYLLGSLAAQAREPGEAVTHFERAVALDPSFEPAYYDLAISQAGAGQTDAALSTLEKTRARFKHNFQLEFVTGIVQAAAKRYPDALKSFTSAELLAKSGDPERLNHIFYFQVGAASERAGRYDEAEAAFRRCLELAPDYAEALNYLGYMWAERGVNLDEAHQLIARAVAAEPESAAFLDSMAWVLFKQGKTTEALDWMERALQRIEKPDATLLDHHGDILWALGREEEARAAWRKSLEIEANDAIREKLERGTIR